MKLLKRLLIALVLVGVLGVWILQPFKEVSSVNTGNEGHQITAPIGINESIVQHFKAVDNNLIELKFAVDFDERYPKEGELLFELIDANGNVLSVEKMDYAQVPDYKYIGAIINLPLDKGEMYAYRITNVDITENLPCAIYTTDPEMCRLKKGEVEFAGGSFAGELLTQITSNKPLETDETMMICGCIGMVGFLLYEVLVCLEKRKSRASASKA